MAKRGPKGPSKYTEEYLEKLADKLDKWIKVETNYWLGEFAVENEMDRHTLADLAGDEERCKKLFDTYKKAKQVQENRLVKKGQSKSGNVAFTIFTLKNVSGWRDKQEIEHLVGGAFGQLLKEIANEKQQLIDRTIKDKPEGQEMEIKQSILDQR